MLSATAITREGYEKRSEEFVELTQQKLPQAIRRIQEALEQGSTVENSDFEVAQEELQLLYKRIDDLQLLLEKATLIPDDDDEPKNEIDLGCRVTVYVQGNTKEFDLVGELEANPLESKISAISPLGKALLGKRVGDLVKVKAPMGELFYEVKSIQ